MKRLLLIICTTALIAACTTTEALTPQRVTTATPTEAAPEPTSTPEETPIPEPTPSDDQTRAEIDLRTLAGTRWALVEMPQLGNVADEDISLTINEDTFEGFYYLECLSYHTPYTQEGTNLQLAHPTTDHTGCTLMEMTHAAADYVDYIAQAESVGMRDDGRLILGTPQGDLVYQPSQKRPYTLTPLTGTRWQLVSIAGESIDQRVTLRFARIINGYGGVGLNPCEGYEGRYTLEGQSIGFEQRDLRRLCSGDRQPQPRYYELLAAADTYTQPDADTLIITTPEGDLIYERDPITFTMFDIRWQLESVNGQPVESSSWVIFNDVTLVAVSQQCGLYTTWFTYREGLLRHGEADYRPECGSGVQGPEADFIRGISQINTVNQPTPDTLILSGPGLEMTFSRSVLY